MSAPFEVKWIGCAPKNFRRGRAGFTPEAIVIHIIVGSLKSADNSFLNPAHGTSAHFGVGRGGEVHQYVAETDTAFHAGTVVLTEWQAIRAGVNPNLYTVGIEHEGFPDDVWPDVQYETSARLIAEIARRWNIPLDEDHVIPHHLIRASKPCPGKDVDLVRLRDHAARLNSTKPVAGGGLASAKIVKPVHLRRDAPSRQSASAGVLRPPHQLRVLEVKENGETIRDNALWYRVDTDLWVWSGATDQPRIGLAG